MDLVVLSFSNLLEVLNYICFQLYTLLNEPQLKSNSWYICLLLKKSRNLIARFMSFPSMMKRRIYKGPAGRRERSCDLEPSSVRGDACSQVSHFPCSGGLWFCHPGPTHTIYSLLFLPQLSGHALARPILYISIYSIIFSLSHPEL